MLVDWRDCWLLDCIVPEPARIPTPDGVGRSTVAALVAPERAFAAQQSRAGWPSGAEMAIGIS